ncbi:MAG: metallophosphoesterase [Pirellulales bacterium]|nr:metallophosphoesterase [Pirellulales bacterium]
MSKCYFASDLHLFANRSNAHWYLDEISRAASVAEHFVLGGDIFDFRWARIPTLRAVEAAARWLDDLTSQCNKCRFHLVLGNHDYHQVLIDRLARLEKQIPNLSWHRFYVRLGASVFLHGDVAERRMDARTLAEARQEWLNRRRRGPFLSKMYDVVVLTNLHKPVPHLVYSKRIVVRRITRYLESIEEGPGNGVRDVYFGHTHKKLSNYHYRGLNFHNGGAGIKGVKFRIIEANC